MTPHCRLSKEKRAFERRPQLGIFNPKRIRHNLRKCRLCRFSCFFGDVDCPNKIPDDCNRLFLCSCAGNFLRLLNFNSLHKGSDNLRSKLCDVRVPTNKGKKFPLEKKPCFGRKINFLLTGSLGSGAKRTF